MGTTSALGDFIRSHKREILEKWKSLSRGEESARRLGESQLVDHVPFLLDRIAKLSDSGSSAPLSMTEVVEPREHARQRVVEGFDLSDVVAEYARLRECILELWEASGHDSAAASGSTRPLHRALDHAIAESVDHYVVLRNRTLKALDHVSSAAFESTSLDAFLDRLLRVFLETMPTVQTCAILLCEGEWLRLRASVGLEEGLSQQGFAMRFGEGFAGTVAATGKPLLLRSAASDSLVKTRVLHERGVKALYGVPLRRAGERVIGVVHMGSLTAEDFSEEDKDLFGSLVSRASLAVEYHLEKSKAEDAAMTRDDMLAVVSHDLRTPISNVRMGIDLVRRALPESVKSERVEKALSSMTRSIAQMTRLVSDLLDLGSIAAHTLRLDVRPEEPAQIVGDAADAHAALAQERGIALRVETEPNLPPVACDRDRVFQALSNLLGNALKFTPGGKSVTLRCKRKDGAVCFSVSDEGTGIAREELPHVFDRYFRGAGSRGQGRGLGLAIVKGIVEAHGGHVHVTSEPGEGSTFSFDVPTA